jgi:hypothetical protein
MRENDFIDCGMTMYTPAGPVDLVPLYRRLEGDRHADVVNDERPAAILALTHLGHPVERIAAILNMHPARVREVLVARGMAEVPAEASESIAGVACTSAAQRRAKRRAERIEVDGRPFHPDAPHGTDYAYTDFGCHCTPCQAAHAAALAETRRRKAVAA